MDRSKLEQREAERMLVLRHVHDVSEGDLHGRVEWRSIPDAVGLDRETVDRTVHYLLERGLVQAVTMGEVSLTISGLSVVESTMKEPDPIPPAAPAQQIVFNAPANVAWHSPNANQSQVISAGVDLPALARFLDQLRDTELPSSIDEEVRTIEGLLRKQIASAQPSPSRIRSLVSSVVAALKDGAETVTAVRTLLDAHAAVLAALGAL